MLSVSIGLYAFVPWGQRERVNCFQCLYIDVPKRICHLVQRRAMISSELFNPVYTSTERVYFRKGMYVRPYFHGPSPESVPRGGNVGLRLRYASRDGEECPYNSLCSNSLDSIDRPHGLVLTRVHPDIRGVVHNWRHYRYK